MSEFSIDGYLESEDDGPVLYDADGNPVGTLDEDGDFVELDETGDDDEAEVSGEGWRRIRRRRGQKLIDRGRRIKSRNSDSTPKRRAKPVRAVKRKTMAVPTEMTFVGDKKTASADNETVTVPIELTEPFKPMQAVFDGCSSGVRVKSMRVGSTPIWQSSSSSGILASILDSDSQFKHLMRTGWVFENEKITVEFVAPSSGDNCEVTISGMRPQNRQGAMILRASAYQSAMSESQGCAV